jgi:predicted GNAT superfamily acetyltransferase
MVIRELEHLEELKLCEALERRVWQIEDLELTPASHLSAVIHAGGLVAGAFADELAGFVYAFPACHPGRDAGLHSHLLAVLPEYRGAGVGKRLKWFQRRWCLSRGLNWMTWTFDPLQAGNARLNLEHLGAVSDTYFVDAYGRLGGALNAELPTDRLVAFWDLRRAEVEKLAAGERQPQLELDGIPAVLRALTGETPSEVDTEQHAPKLRAEIPADLTVMLAERPEMALRWRLTLRAALQHYFARGYTATRFLEGAYVLEK